MGGTRFKELLAQGHEQAAPADVNLQTQDNPAITGGFNPQDMFNIISKPDLRNQWIQKQIGSIPRFASRFMQRNRNY